MFLNLYFKSKVCCFCDTSGIEQNYKIKHHFKKKCNETVHFCNERFGMPRLEKSSRQKVSWVKHLTFLFRYVQKSLKRAQRFFCCGSRLICQSHLHIMLPMCVLTTQQSALKQLNTYSGFARLTMSR